jgi:hypothetical protein
MFSAISWLVAVVVRVLFKGLGCLCGVQWAAMGINGKLAFKTM